MMMYELIRSFGLVAYLGFSLSLALGVASVTGGVTHAAIDRRVVRQLLHRSAAVVGLLTLVTHIALTVVDSYIATPLHAVVIPFTSGYQPFALGLGSLALYSFVAAALSGWLRLSIAGLLSERAWRWVHRSAYAGWALCLGHGILAGPDTHHLWALGTYAAGIAAVLIGIGVRIAGSRHVLRRDVDGAFQFQEVGR